MGITEPSGSFCQGAEVLRKLRRVNHFSIWMDEVSYALSPFSSGVGKSLEHHSETFGRVDGYRCHLTRFFALFRAILSLSANFKIFYMVLLSTKMPEIALFIGVLSDFLT